MEIFDQQSNTLQANISSKYPVFTVNGLDSGKLLKIIIYAINVKGRSELVLLEAFTLKAAEKQTGNVDKAFQFRAFFSASISPLFNHMSLWDADFVKLKMAMTFSINPLGIV